MNMAARGHKFLLGGLGLWLSSGLTQAHTLPGDTGGFHHGFTHPFMGWDHLLAMVAVGLWAAQHRGRAVWLLPLTFVGVMLAGGALGLTQAHLPGVEFFIAASLLVLGGLIAFAARFAWGWSALIVGVFALFHGFAHGQEMPANASAATFSTGFVLATIILHGLGLAAGWALQQQARPQWLRWAGASVALSSFAFFVK